MEGSGTFENETVLLWFNGNCPALEVPAGGAMTHDPAPPTQPPAGLVMPFIQAFSFKTDEWIEQRKKAGACGG